MSRNQTKKKRWRELCFWLKQKAFQHELDDSHYKYYYTTHFNIENSFYENKKIIDIGCGPRGSLKWATMASERVGLDPLVDSYAKLGIDKHNMNYVNSKAENIPFPDGYFDVVCSFNSLDHVDDLNKVIKEIKRVTHPNGLLLLITEVNHPSTVTEPLSFSWNIADKFEPEFNLIWKDGREKSMNGVYDSARFGKSYNYSSSSLIPGILSAKFQKK